MSQESCDSVLDALISNSPNIKNCEDILVVVVHGFLLSKGFKLSSESEGSVKEKLPQDWNSNEDYYELHYYSKGKKHLLKALKTEGALSFYLLNSDSGDISDISFIINECVQSDDTTLPLVSRVSECRSAVPNMKEICQQLESFIVPSNANKLQQQVTQENKKHDGIEMRNDRFGSNQVLRTSDSRSYNPAGYGHEDLYPGAFGTGGMLFDPLRSGGRIHDPLFGPPPGLPRGGVPGARFDPVGPFAGPGRGSQPHRAGFPEYPDPDHLRRPGFDDDMFM